MADRQVLEALAAREGRAVEVENLKAYRLTLEGGQAVLIVAKVAPGIRSAVAKATGEDGLVRPCFWRTSDPWYQEIRADMVIQIEEMCGEEVAAVLAVFDEEDGDDEED